MAHTAKKQTEANNAIHDDHHGSKYCVTGKACLFLRCGDHHGYDERDLYNRDRHCKHQRSKRLAGSMRDTSA